jgi:hypothetical protein
MLEEFFGEYLVIFCADSAARAESTGKGSKIGGSKGSSRCLPVRGPKGFTEICDHP